MKKIFFMMLIPKSVSMESKFYNDKKYYVNITRNGRLNDAIYGIPNFQKM